MGRLKPQSNGDDLYVQQYGDWYNGRWWVGCEEGPRLAGCGPAQSPPRCNSPPFNDQCTKFILFDVALWLLLQSKGLTELVYNYSVWMLHVTQQANEKAWEDLVRRTKHVSNTNSFWLISVALGVCCGVGPARRWRQICETK